MLIIPYGWLHVARQSLRHPARALGHRTGTVSRDPVTPVRASSDRRGELLLHAGWSASTVSPLPVMSKQRSKRPRFIPCYYALVVSRQPDEVTLGLATSGSGHKKCPPLGKKKGRLTNQNGCAILPRRRPNENMSDGHFGMGVERRKAYPSYTSSKAQNAADSSIPSSLSITDIVTRNNRQSLPLFAITHSSRSADLDDYPTQLATFAKPSSTEKHLQEDLSLP
ncbi:MAG: hypothetical protein FRX48_09380 [Lasallia pustulata]|uniref:Uncharacterized protein n=1 Tax=Lasallia pustulata TaxID=136370 RepID=A0A5M8PDR2_9LECA|nr:MAG: hypothetical protein FRX48_09380 [Lasallia pustulata]